MQNNARQSRFLQLSGLVFWIGICFFVAWTGAQVSPGIASADWYNSLNKPSWNPPNWIFGPVWTLLYTLMGIAAWLIWKNFGFHQAGKALSFFIIQLLLNGVWSQLFFGLELPGWAFFEILILLAAIVLTIYFFSKKHTTAAWLLVPYLAWAAFATALNGAIWWMNS